MHSFGHVVSRWFVAGWMFMLLGIGIAVSPAAHAQGTADRSGELQQLVDALGDQIDMQRSFNRAKAEASRARLRQAIQAWQKAARTDNDFELMRIWLEQALQASLAGSRMPLPPVPSFTRPEVARTPAPAPTSIEPTSPGAPARPPHARVTEELPVAAPEPPAERPPVAATRPSRSPSRRTTTDEATPDSPWARHPAATPIALGDPFVDDPLPQQPEVAPAVATTPNRVVEPKPSQTAVDPLQNARVVLRPTTTETTRDEDSVGINLAALAARIRGHDRGLRGIEARLIANPNLAIEDLLLLTKELETLAEQRKLIDLYVEALNPAERARVAPPESAEPLKRMIGERANRLRPTAQPDDLVDDVFSEQPSPAHEEIESVLKSI